jgi:hypothetical protein
MRSSVQKNLRLKDFRFPNSAFRFSKMVARRLIWPQMNTDGRGFLLSLFRLPAHTRRHGKELHYQSGMTPL